MIHSFLLSIGFLAHIITSLFTGTSEIQATSTPVVITATTSISESVTPATSTNIVTKIIAVPQSPKTIPTSPVVVQVPPIVTVQATATVSVPTITPSNNAPATTTPEFILKSQQSIAQAEAQQNIVNQKQSDNNQINLLQSQILNLQKSERDMSQIISGTFGGTSTTPTEANVTYNQDAQQIIQIQAEISELQNNLK